MSNRKERRLMLKQLGILNLNKKKPSDVGANIEKGKNLHRQYLQNVKNEDNRKNSVENTDNASFFSENIDDKYSSFQSLLMKKNWDEPESNT
jgi:hypothetical protein